jgi:hypothetical protein
MWKLIVEKAKDFGRARQLPLLSLIMFGSWLVSRIMILREEESSNLEPLTLRYMELWRGMGGNWKESGERQIAQRCGWRIPEETESEVLVGMNGDVIGVGVSKQESHSSLL